jgi:eukaryotic-like serine/threonine-protein kinase
VNAERWQRVKSLFERALDHPPSTRDQLLEQSGESPSVVAEVRKLISSDAQAGSFLEHAASAEFSAAPVLSPGDVVSGHFRIVSLLGRGGMGVVYRAEDLVLSRAVALKFLPGGLRGTTQALERLKREARAASALSHPNIVTIHEIGEQDGRTFIVMELVDGKPLSELIPSKGMRLPEALRIAAQVAGALAAAHAAGIVHRDLKPANIMVDLHGRVRVLDFGLAKLATPAAAPPGPDEATRTFVVEDSMTEEGVIVGSVPYMSPEQVEGQPVDTRSDIFSFGAVLYEMITGQRAFRGESRASTLAAIVERDPSPLSEISSSTPPEVERLISRCLRKDVNRRSQSMADVKLALEELRDESESGNLARPVPRASTETRRWVWPAVATAFVLIAAAVFTWIYLNAHRTPPKGPDLVRVSPDDGHSYASPAISPDGGFVAYVSDRSGKDELWLQQVGGGDPIQLTHSTERVAEPVFFPDGKRILYVRTSLDNQKSALEVISALGGDPRVLFRGARITNEDPKVSPDGRQIAFFEYNQSGRHLMTLPSDGGQPRELTAWKRLAGRLWSGRTAWTSDSRFLLCMVTKNDGTKTEEIEWFAVPSDGGEPVATGVDAALLAAGITRAAPYLMVGDRALFGAGSLSRWNTWEIRLSPGPWRARGVPRQLTFGTMFEMTSSVSANGILALQVGSIARDLYLAPLSAATGQPTGVVRRITRDGREKNLLWYPRGAPESAYFSIREETSLSVYGVDLNSGKQTLVAALTPSAENLSISPDGRQIAYSVPENDSYSIRVSDVGANQAAARVLCKACGLVQGFSPDGRFLFYHPEAKVKYDPKRKLSTGLLELASGKERPWLEHATDSVLAGVSFGPDSRWLTILLVPPGSPSSIQRYFFRWTEQPLPQSDWHKIPWDATTTAARWRVSPAGNFFYLFQGSKLVALRFHPESFSFSEPEEVKFVPGSDVKPQPVEAANDVGLPQWTVRGPGLVFSHDDDVMSVWLMKLPR